MGRKLLLLRVLLALVFLATLGFAGGVLYLLFFLVPFSRGWSTRGSRKIFSTLDPDNPDDAPWIEEEREIAEENDLEFTLMPLAPLSPAATREVVQHVKDAEGKVYLHAFVEAERFEALKKDLDRQYPGGADRAGD